MADIILVDAQIAGEGASSRNSGYLVDTTLNDGFTSDKDLNNYKKTSLYINLHNPDFIIHLASRTTPRINSSVEYKKQSDNYG